MKQEILTQEQVVQKVVSDALNRIEPLKTNDECGVIIPTVSRFVQQVLDRIEPEIKGIETNPLYCPNHIITLTKTSEPSVDRVTINIAKQRKKPNITQHIENINMKLGDVKGWGEQ